MSALKKPKRFEVHLYVSHFRFKDDSWKYDVGEELYTLGKQLMKGMDVIPARILDHGGSVGEIIIEYPEDEDESAASEKPNKSDAPRHVDGRDGLRNLKQDLADILIRIAAELKNR